MFEGLGPSAAFNQAAFASPAAVPPKAAGQMAPMLVGKVDWVEKKPLEKCVLPRNIAHAPCGWR